MKILIIISLFISSLFLFGYISEQLMWWRMNNYKFDGKGNIEVIDKKKEKRRALIIKITSIFVGLILIFGLVKISNAETNTWKFSENATIEKCVVESNQSKEVCETIIELIKESEKTEEIVVGVVQTREESNPLLKIRTEIINEIVSEAKERINISDGVDWIDLSNCYIGNDDDICQGRVNPLHDKYKREFIPKKPIINKGHSILVKNDNSLDQVNKSNSILVPDARYIGDGKYCYPIGNKWQCEK